MKTVIVGSCSPEAIFSQTDPASYTEVEFEEHCIRALSCIYPDYLCIRFEVPFTLDGKVSKPDLAMISKRMSHWYVLEVELASHSLEFHVLPQVKAFRYGDIDIEAAVRVINKNSNISISQAQTLVKHVPRFVAVAMNRPRKDWLDIFKSHDVQCISVAIYKNKDELHAHELVGTLQAKKEVVARGKYFAGDRSFLFPNGNEVPSTNRLQLTDPFGGLSYWMVQKREKEVWLTKENGSIELDDQVLIQLIRDYSGSLSISVPG